MIAQHWRQGRTYISRLLCERWHWRQPNGRLKDRACRVMLLALEARGLIQLPPRQKIKVNRRRSGASLLFDLNLTPFSGSIAQYSALELVMVRRTPQEALWDSLVNQYHYLGCPWLVGAYLKYLAYLEGEVVACLGFSSAAWKVRCRDEFINWTTQQRQTALAYVANNARFLILPQVSIKNLASKVLSLCAQRVSADWQAFFGHPIYLLETFVEPGRFLGTCYRAANWIYLGQTHGSAKRGASYHYHGQAKAVYVYPLVGDFRRRLTGEGSPHLFNP